MTADGIGGGTPMRMLTVKRVLGEGRWWVGVCRKELGASCEMDEKRDEG